MRTESPLEVAVGVLHNSADEVLIAWRDAHRHQGGCWEFPGGKIEPGEPALAALTRELDEELGVQVLDAEPLIRIPHQYDDRAVILHVYNVRGWQGEPHGVEHQALAWRRPNTLSAQDFPPANGAIITALRLPRHYVVSADASDPDGWLGELDATLARGERLLQFRVAGDDGTRAMLAREALARCHQQGAELMINSDFRLAAEIGADGVHMNSHQLAQGIDRPVGFRGWLSAACHSPADLKRAADQRADFAVLSPVAATPSHPHGSPLGWAQWARWVAEARLPVYALGGLHPSDGPLARRHGAQGIAAIRALWGQLSG